MASDPVDTSAEEIAQCRKALEPYGFGHSANVMDALVIERDVARADALAAASREQEARAEASRLRDVLRDIAADCEAVYPPSHGAIKYVCRLALKECHRD